MPQLADLNLGERAKVTGFTPGDSNKVYKNHLLAMGLVPGTEFRLIRIAPMGDPVGIKVRNYMLCLRQAEAAVLEIEKLADE